jgi:3-hydroxybutyryl-CoA dehydrogenase
MDNLKLGVIGAGAMGGGIAQIAATAGFDVTVRDVSDAALERGFKNVTSSLTKLESKGKLADASSAILSRITTTLEFEGLAHCDLIIEAALENMDVKREIFTALDAITKPSAVLATNTSSLSVTQIASFTKNPSRVIGMHFFNPVPLMQLVEIVRGLQSGDEAVQLGVDVGTRMGKTPIVCKDAPGFIVNRLLVPYLNDAIHALSEGVSSAEDIDTAMKLGANMPIGPLALCDLVGLDVQLAAIESLYAEFSDPKFKPAPLLRQMVRAGKLGRKTGDGFYRYEK